MKPCTNMLHIPHSSCIVSAVLDTAGFLCLLFWIYSLLSWFIANASSLSLIWFINMNQCETSTSSDNKQQKCPVLLPSVSILNFVFTLFSFQKKKILPPLSASLSFFSSARVPDSASKPSPPLPLLSSVTVSLQLIVLPPQPPPPPPRSLCLSSSLPKL